MSETLKGGVAGDERWENMSEDISIEKRLEDGEAPEEIIKSAYEEGILTPDFMEEYGSTLMQYGLNEDKYEYYEQLSRKHGDESAEDVRHRFDEEPEQEGYENEEPKIA